MAPTETTDDELVFVRPRDLEPITDDLSLIMVYLMNINAKLERIEKLIRNDEDEEDGTDA